MKLGLILSNDWELWGSGAGDYWDLQHSRLRELLSVVEEFDAPLTIMAEVGQQWAHRELGKREPWAGRIADDWEQSLVAAKQRGSDVQLHFHPQWIGAKRDADNWVVDYSRWAFSDLSSAEMRDSLAAGKEYLETLLKPIDPLYRTVLFRAGSFCVAPAAGAVDALRSTGFLADSSVVKAHPAPEFAEYRDAPDHVIPWQTADDSFARSGKDSGIIELPVASIPANSFRVLRHEIPKRAGMQSNADRQFFHRQREYLARQYPSERRAPRQVDQSKWQKILRLGNSLLRSSSIRLDYDSLSPAAFVSALEAFYLAAKRRFSAETDVVVPVMAIGHCKSIPDGSNLDRILRRVVSRFGDSLIFQSGQAATETWHRCVTRGDLTMRKNVGQFQSAA